MKKDSCKPTHGLGTWSLGLGRHLVGDHVTAHPRSDDLGLRRLGLCLVGRLGTGPPAVG